jgi:hypothetical protein
MQEIHSMTWFFEHLNFKNCKYRTSNAFVVCSTVLPQQESSSVLPPCDEKKSKIGSPSWNKIFSLRFVSQDSLATTQL